MQLPVNTPTDVKITIQRLENKTEADNVNIVRKMQVDNLVLSMNAYGAALFANTPDAPSLVLITAFYDFTWHKTMLTPDEIEQLSAHIANLMGVQVVIDEKYSTWKDEKYIATAALEDVHGEPDYLRLWVNSADTAILREYSEKHSYSVTSGFGMSYIIMAKDTIRQQVTHDELLKARIKLTKWAMQFYRLTHIVQR